MYRCNYFSIGSCVDLRGREHDKHVCLRKAGHKGACHCFRCGVTWGADEVLSVDSK